MKRLAAFFGGASSDYNEQQVAPSSRKQVRSRQALSVLNENCCREPVLKPVVKAAVEKKEVKLLSTLPVELIFTLFDYLPARDLVSFAACSRCNSSLVFSYASNQSNRRRVFPVHLRHRPVLDDTSDLVLNSPVAHHPAGPFQDIVEADVDYSLLVMVSTAHKSQHERIRIFANWLVELLCIPPKWTFPSRNVATVHIEPCCPNAAHCVGLYASGAFLYMVTAHPVGQQRSEWLSIFYQHLNAKLGLERMVERILTAPRGNKFSDEFYVRLFILRLFILPGLCNQDLTWSAFWLGRFLRRLSHFDRSRLLILLTAPCDYASGKINWLAFTRPQNLISTRQEAESIFKEMGDLLKFIYTQRVLTEQEFVVMVGYLLSNNDNNDEDPSLTAFLLHFSGSEVAEVFLRSTLNPVRQMELPNIRFSYIVDVLFYMVGVAFLTRQTLKFAEILDLIKRLSPIMANDSNFMTNIAFRLGHRLAEQLLVPESEFRQQLFFGGQNNQDDDNGLIFVGHLLSVLLQRGIANN